MATDRFHRNFNEGTWTCRTPSSVRRASKAEQAAPHYFSLMKQLSLLGFFTSKPGATKVLRYIPVPGKYEGCIDYKKGETAWA